MFTSWGLRTALFLALPFYITRMRARAEKTRKKSKYFCKVLLKIIDEREKVW